MIVASGALEMFMKITNNHLIRLKKVRLKKKNSSVKNVSVNSFTVAHGSDVVVK